jgi:Rab-GTPase-TBC domain
MPGVDSEVLLSVLRTYALFNPVIEYCQGMNYVAGFLLMVFKDPEVTFKALITIVERFGIADLFN